MVTLREIERCIPQDHSKQVDASYYIEQADHSDAEVFFVDLGAGDGRSFDIASKKFPELRWIGVDIEDSLEVRKRKRTDCSFVSYDGINIPCEDNSVDIVYSRQVFEHVRHPEALMKSIGRVLKSGGVFIGSASQLEPYHSRSFWNYTYFGLATLAVDAGMRLGEFRPGIDGLSLIMRHIILNLAKDSSKERFLPWFNESSPGNDLLQSYCESLNMPVRQINQIKLRYSGHVCFKFYKR